MNCFCRDSEFIFQHINQLVTPGLGDLNSMGIYIHSGTYLPFSSMYTTKNKMNSFTKRIFGDSQTINKPQCIEHWLSWTYLSYFVHVGVKLLTKKVSVLLFLNCIGSNWTIQLNCPASCLKHNMFYELCSWKYELSIKNCGYELNSP